MGEIQDQAEQSTLKARHNVSRQCLLRNYMSSRRKGKDSGTLQSMLRKVPAADGVLCTPKMRSGNVVLRDIAFGGLGNARPREQHVKIARWRVHEGRGTPSPNTENDSP